MGIWVYYSILNILFIGQTYILKYCCKVCGHLNNAQSWVDGHLKCTSCGQLIKSIDNAVCIGQHIADRYELQKLLEQRTYNNIYIAHDLYSDRTIILRLYFWNFTYSVTDAEKFLEVAQSVSHLAQPTHLKITDCGKTPDGLLYTVWPYENIESVTRLLQVNGHFEPFMAVSICKDIVTCLENFYNETGVHHFNLNTNKFYLNNQGQARISDLGHAAFLLQDDHFVYEESEYFNERFLAPEVVLDEGIPNIHSDIFSMGACLYTMVTGLRPFDHLEFVTLEDYKNLKLRASLEHKAGKPFTKLLYKLMAINPKERYTNWRSVTKDMERYLCYNEEVNTNSRRCSLTTKFDYELQNPVETEDKEEKAPILLSAPAMSLLLNTQKPLRKRHRKNTTLRWSFAFAASMAIAFTLYLVNKQDINSAIKVNMAKFRTEKTLEQTVTQPDTTTINKIKTRSNETPSASLKSFSVSTPEQDFDELKFQVREFTLVKKWSKALELIQNYSGPYQSENSLLKNEVIRRKNTPLIQDKSFSIGPFFAASSTVASPRPLQGLRDFTALAELILNLKFKESLSLIETIEQEQSVDLNFFKDVIHSSSQISLQKKIIHGYKYDFGQKISLKLKKEGPLTGTLFFMDSKSGELTITTADNHNQSISLNELAPEENIKRIHHSDDNKEILLKVIYALQNNKESLAASLIKEYNGPSKREFSKAIKITKADNIP